MRGPAWRRIRKHSDYRPLEELCAGLDTREDIDQLYNCTTPLLAACQNSHVEFALWLLDHGADPNKAMRRTGRPPIHFASKARCLTVVRALLDAGADAGLGLHAITTSNLKNTDEDRRVVHALINRGVEHFHYNATATWVRDYAIARQKRRVMLRALGAAVCACVRTKDTQRLIINHAK